MQRKTTRRKLASELCDRLKGKQNKLKIEMKKAVDRAKSRKRALEALVECMQDHLADRIARWQRDLYRDESEAASETIHELRTVAANAFSAALERACVEGGSSLEGIAFRPDVLFDEEALAQLVGDEADEIDLDDVYESEEPDDPDDDPDKRSLWDRFLDWLWGNSEGNWKQQLHATIPDIVEKLVGKEAEDVARKYVRQLVRDVARTVLGKVTEDPHAFAMRSTIGSSCAKQRSCYRYRKRSGTRLRRGKFANRCWNRSRAVWRSSSVALRRP